MSGRAVVAAALLVSVAIVVAAVLLRGHRTVYVCQNDRGGSAYGRVDIYAKGCR